MNRGVKMVFASALAIGAVSSSAALAYGAFDRREPTSSFVPPVHVEPKGPKSTEAVALALALDAVSQVPGPDQPDAYLDLARTWNNRTYRWEGAYVEPMCRMASACALAPFDRARYEGTALQGWMSRLTLDEAQHARLRALCEGKPSCVVEFEGRMSVRASVATFTAVSFDHVEILGVREAREGEYWFGTPPQQ